MLVSARELIITPVFKSGLGGTLQFFQLNLKLCCATNATLETPVLPKHLLLGVLEKQTNNIMSRHCQIDTNLS